jgi:predicted nucleic acid-binding Zn ribbon protein
VKPEIRQRALNEWRGLPQPLADVDRSQPVGKVLEKVMRSMGLNDRLTEAQIITAWKEIVGDWFALHTCPNRLRDGVLSVQVIQSAVHCELQLHKAEILRKLKTRFGARKIRDVKFRAN